jgi:predicted nucleic acid-binding protein
VKKLRVYLDTSVISHLDAPDVPEREADTKRLWEDIKAGKYEAVLSNVVFDEVNDCDEPKRSFMREEIAEIEHTLVDVGVRGVEVASRFVDLGILRQKSFDDCQHIAAAIISGCDAIVSWNFKHIVNHKTMMGVKAVTALEGYDDLLIYTPSILIGGEHNDS